MGVGVGVGRNPLAGVTACTLRFRVGRRQGHPVQPSGCRVSRRTRIQRRRTASPDSPSFLQISNQTKNWTLQLRDGIACCSASGKCGLDTALPCWRPEGTKGSATPSAIVAYVRGAESVRPRLSSRSRPALAKQLDSDTCTSTPPSLAALAAQPGRSPALSLPNSPPRPAPRGTARFDKSEAEDREGEGKEREGNVHT